MQTSPKPSTRRSQTVRRQESWRKLVRAAVLLIAEKGVGATTFQAIGAKSGYSASLVTERFGSKRGLTEAVIAYLQEELDHMIGHVERKRVSGLEALLRYVEVWLAELAHNPERRAHFMLLSASVSDPSDLHSIFAAAHGRVRERLGNLVERGRSDGSIKASIVADAAALMIGAIQLGLSIQFLVDPAMDLDADGRNIIDTLRGSLAAETKPD
ncbi:TetR/AcrR family transcriptional regulator [Sphingobium sp. JS3065]|nr:TetR/AcrR family transcriptional regulator [Sphingobium sp. JS3065]